MLFGWKIISAVPYNSILYVKNEATVSIAGAGQDRMIVTKD